MTNGTGPVGARTSDHWAHHARQWSHVGAPLRPGPEDLAAARRALDEWLVRPGRADATVLVLGVTPELCALPDSAVDRVLAVDNSGDMIRSVWPGRLRARDAAVCADWRALPLASASVDVAFIDGGLGVFEFPSGYRDLCDGLRRALRPGGRFVARCFASPERREPLE